MPDDGVVFEVEHVGDPTEPVIALRGELDLASAPLLAAALDSVFRSPARRLTVDCSRLSFSDGTGLALLLGASERLAAGVVLRRPPDALRRLIGVLGLDRELQLLD